MDLVGPQKKIAGNKHHESRQKLIDEGAPKDLGGGYNTKSGTREADFASAPYKESQWAGTTKGKIKHTYGHTYGAKDIKK